MKNKLTTYDYIKRKTTEKEKPESPKSSPRMSPISDPDDLGGVCNETVIAEVKSISSNRKIPTTKTELNSW